MTHELLTNLTTEPDPRQSVIAEALGDLDLVAAVGS